MKKSSLLGLLTLALVPGLEVNAYDFKSLNNDGVCIYYNYVPNSDNVEVTFGDDPYSGDVNIPATVDYSQKTYTVNAITEYAFSGCSELKSLVIPSGVWGFGSNAFYNCTGLSEIIIPSGCTFIGYKAFEGCTGLKTIQSEALTPPCCEAGDVFENGPDKTTTVLKVCKESIGLYSQKYPWSEFANIDGLVSCATPVITIENDNQIVVRCATEGASIHTLVKCKDQGSYNSSSGESISLSGVYVVTSYATAVGYRTSESTSLSFSVNFSGNIEVNEDPSGSDGALVSAFNVFEGNLLQTLTDGDVISTFTYNDKGQLISVTEKSLSTQQLYETTEYKYIGGNINGFDYDLMIKSENDYYQRFMYIRIGDNLFASSVYEEEISDEESDFQTWEFEYNEAGQLVKMFRSEGDNETTTINYADGNIVNVTQTAPEQDTLAYQISYTNSIMNTAGVMLYDCCFGIDMDEMGLAYYAGLLGKATTCLPQKKSCSEDDEPEQFNWSIGADGYPSKVESQWSQYSFTWGERSSGVQEIIDEKSYQGVKEYYNINGMRQNQPTQGLNIIRNTDGTSSKILLR